MAAYFSSEAGEFDDGLEFDRRSDLGPDYYRAAGYDGVAPAWTGPISAGRGADDHFSPYFSRQYELQRHEDALEDLYRHSEHQPRRQVTRRPHSGAATVREDHWSASSRISGLRISPVSVTNASRQFLGRNAPRTGSEEHQHVISERGVRQNPSRMSGRASEMPTGGLRSASAASAAARVSAFVSSSPVIRDPASVSASASVVGLPAVRPITNASRNIKFGMLQPHFERPLQEAALKFGVCTTLLKKICRKNGIANWPFRKICGLRKSITSMEKQVQYFDGEQKQTYAEQLRKLQVELEAYRRIGMAPTPEFIQLMDEEEEQQQQERAWGENAHDDDEVAAGSENRVDDEEEDSEVVTLADREEKQQRETERVSPLQHEPRRPDSPPSKLRASKSQSRSSSSSSHSVHCSRPDSFQEYHEARPSTFGGRYDEHLHQDRVHSRPPDVVARGYAPDHHAYDDHRHHQLQSEHRPQRHLNHEHQPHHEHWHHHHHHQTQPLRSRPHSLGMSTIGIHQHALPSIGSLLHRQDRDPSTPSDARGDRSRRDYERRGDLQ